LQQAYADSNAETTYPHSDTPHANSVSNSVAIFVANPYANSNGNPYGDCYTNSHGDPYRYGNAHGDPYRYGNAYGYRYTNCNGNAYRYGNTNCNAHGHPYGYRYSNCDCYTNPHAGRMHLHARLLENSRQRELPRWQQRRRMASEYSDSWDRVLHEG
jgi:hypothetical protein